jgi:hypothetical protein
MVPKFALMPEANDAAAAERNRRLRGVELEQARARGGGAEHAERGGRMPALHVMMKVHAERDLGLRLEACDVCRDEFAPARADFIGEREQRGQHGRRRVAAERVVAVVEIERVRRGAVDYGSVERAHAAVGAENVARACACAQRARGKLRRVFAAAGERHADGIEHADFGPVHGVLRQVFEFDGGDALREFDGDGH